MDKDDGVPSVIKATSTSISSLHKAQLIYCNSDMACACTTGRWISKKWRTSLRVVKADHEPGKTLGQWLDASPADRLKMDAVHATAEEAAAADEVCYNSSMHASAVMFLVSAGWLCQCLLAGLFVSVAA